MSYDYYEKNLGRWLISMDILHFFGFFKQSVGVAVRNIRKSSVTNFTLKPAITMDDSETSLLQNFQAVSLLVLK